MKVAAIVTIAVAGGLATAPAVANSAAHSRGVCRAGVLHPVGDQVAAYAAVVNGKTRAYKRPNGSLRASFSKLTDLGYPTTFSIVGAILNKRCTATWYRVKLPIKPNGVIGYVRPTDVSVEKVTTRISVDLSRRELRLYRRGKLVLRTPVAVGSPSTPTPIGRYFVSQRIRTGTPGGAFGPVVLAVSAFSNILQDWAEGGPIAIHGTNAPWTIGRTASHGCVRVPNDTLMRLFVATPGGTPVVIHP
uniref:Putative L,D-transpeptidase YkuD n=1 Tax=uncultured organism TaxID=155900 RepID=W0NTD6_9ZZZZ|nr:putative L,D-transpeptidase YkuD [uncultured organism]